MAPAGTPSNPRWRPVFVDATRRRPRASRSGRFSICPRRISRSFLFSSAMAFWRLASLTTPGVAGYCFLTGFPAESRSTRESSVPPRSVLPLSLPSSSKPYELSPPLGLLPLYWDDTPCPPPEASMRASALAPILSSAAMSTPDTTSGLIPRACNLLRRRSSEYPKSLAMFLSIVLTSSAVILSFSNVFLIPKPSPPSLRFS